MGYKQTDFMEYENVDDTNMLILWDLNRKILWDMNRLMLKYVDNTRLDCTINCC